MTTLMQADIFFFVTTIAVALVAIGVIIVLIYSIKILHDVRHISTVARKEGDYLAVELAEFRENLHTRRPAVVALFTFIRHLIRHYKHK